VSDEETAASPDKLAEMIMNYSRAQLIRAAVKLEVATRLSGGPRDSAELTEELGANHEALLRFLRACTAIELVREVGSRRFELGPLGEFLRPETPAGSALSTVALGAAGPGMYRIGAFFADVVMTGQPAAKAAFVLDFYDYYEANPTEGKHFGDMMALMTHGCAEGLVEHYDFTKYAQITDIGGSHGMLLSRILRAAPDARGAVYDLPEVLANAKTFLADEGLSDRVTLIPGNFHKEIPAGADLYTIKTVLCDWNDEHVAGILRNIRAAMKPGAKLLIIDWMLPDEAGQADDFLSVGLYLGSFNMLCQSGGKIRTADEWRALLDGAGLAIATTSSFPDPPTRWDLIEVVPK
jgi:hypothetical protein